MSGRKPRRPRWQPTADTMALALHHAAKPARADVDQVLRAVTVAAKALREGVATELQWSILAGSLDVSLAIERQGIVRGLQEHLASAARAMQSIYDRAHAGPVWRPTALHYYELDAVQTFVELHAYQVRQLSRAEFLKAIDSAANQIRATGGQVTLAHTHELERMAA
ncbi:MAG: hypothetical protein Q7U28_08050 [Aquabacterium sp.]|nr:hypothetical protein [Aquabacterium sp.]